MVTTETSVQTHKRTQRRLYGHTIPRKRPAKRVLDYVNGDKSDTRLCNMQWVLPAEAVKRIRIRQILRRDGRDPRNLSMKELKLIFRTYRFASEEEMRKEASHAE